MNEFESVRLWLRNTYNVGVSDEWLMACLEWIQQEHQGVLPSVSDLLPQVFQQWLLSDLTEIGEQVLPQNIVTDEKSELVGNYPLQLLSLVDVGFPLYGQKQKLQGRVNPNDEVSADTPFQPAWEPKPTRMLLLQLTDGHTHIQALEYKQIKDLHAELPGGFKVLVYGRALCRRGVIMLTPECVQVLGGEVDTLVEQNTPVAVLEREMMRNREDEGKHAKTVFSGQFLSRGSDKMLDNSQKYFKKDGYSGLTSCQRLSTPSLQQVKPEPHRLASSSLSQFGLKQEDDPKQYLGQEFKQEDDMNYEDCFSDYLDLQEIDALDCTTAVCMERDNMEAQHPSTGFHRSDPAHSWPGSCEREQLQSTLQNAAGTRTTSDMRLSTSLNQSLASSLSSNPSQLMNVSNTQNDVDVFDDDFEIDDISDNVDVSDKNNTFGLSLPGGKENNTFNSSAESQIMQNPIASSYMKSSQPTLQQAVNKAVPLKPHVSSFAVLSKGQQNDPGRKNKLFKVKTSSLERTENLDTSKFPAKKQVKLSDMFSSSSDRNKSKLMSLSDDCAISGSDKVTQSQQMFDNDDDDDCCIVGDGHTAQKFSRKTDAKLSSNSASKLLNTSSVVAIKSSSGRSVTVSDSDTLTNKTLAERPHPKLEQDCGIQTAACTLAKAVIYPSSSLGLSDVADRSPFQYLSDLTHMQPPASLTVKAYISTLIEKLGTNGGANWSLACRINDGTACLDVDLADDVLVELVGFSAKDSLIMRQKMRSEPRVKDVLMKGLTQCQQKLINMSCLMEVDIVSAVRKPVVKKLIPLSRQHVLELLKRVEKDLSL